jgi:flagellar transcriptional activator FlhD
MNGLNDARDAIREINLSYIMLAQRMLREKGPVAMSTLGLRTEAAEILGNLTMAQVVRLANTDNLLCAFRFNDHSMLSTLAKPQGMTQSAPVPAAALAGEGATQFA